MTQIVNPNPVTPGEFDRMWITNATLRIPVGEKAILVASIRPYDGQHLLATGGKETRLFDIEKTPGVAAMITSLRGEIARQTGNSSAVEAVQVTAADPTSPVSARIVFARNTDGSLQAPANIPDCFGLAGTDPVFAGVFQTTLSTIATLAGLAVQ